MVVGSSAWSSRRSLYLARPGCPGTKVERRKIAVGVAQRSAARQIDLKSKPQVLKFYYIITNQHVSKCPHNPIAVIFGVAVD